MYTLATLISFLCFQGQAYLDSGNIGPQSSPDKNQTQDSFPNYNLQIPWGTPWDFRQTYGMTFYPYELAAGLVTAQAMDFLAPCANLTKGLMDQLERYIAYEPSIDRAISCASSIALPSSTLGGLGLMMVALQRNEVVTIDDSGSVVTIRTKAISGTMEEIIFSLNPLSDIALCYGKGLLLYAQSRDCIEVTGLDIALKDLYAKGGLLSSECNMIIKRISPNVQDIFAIQSQIIASLAAYMRQPTPDNPSNSKSKIDEIIIVSSVGGFILVVGIACCILKLNRRRYRNNGPIVNPPAVNPETAK